MTKLMLAGITALALSVGAFAYAQPVQQQGTPGYSVQTEGAQVPVMSGPGHKSGGPYECWPNCP